MIEANRDTASTGFSRFELILPASHPVSPWTGVVTFWFTLSMWYVGTNQFYIQRCLGARSEWDAKMGVLGCAYIKLLMPFILVLPGMVAFAKFGPGLAEDAVYVKMINEFLPPAGRGLLLATLIAAIMSTVSAVLNSAATIWSMDIHKRFIHKQAGDAELVRVGRWSTFIIIVIGTAFAPILLSYEGGIFIYIQDTNTFIAPPICIIYLAAFVWRRPHGRAATFTLLFGLVSGIALKILGRELGIARNRATQAAAQPGGGQLPPVPGRADRDQLRVAQEPWRIVRPGRDLEPEMGSAAGIGTPPEPGRAEPDVLVGCSGCGVDRPVHHVPLARGEAKHGSNHDRKVQGR